MDFNSRIEGLECVEGYFEHFLPSPSRRDERSHTAGAAEPSGEQHHQRGELYHNNNPVGGDPLQMAAAKQAYMRGLGPAAISFLMGFAPGDAGWRGDEGDAPVRLQLVSSSTKSSFGHVKHTMYHFMVIHSHNMT